MVCIIYNLLTENISGDYYAVQYPVSSLVEGNIYTIVGVYDGSAAKLYVNGSLAETITTPRGEITSPKNQSVVFI